jgi:hypothetical protein
MVLILAVEGLSATALDCLGQIQNGLKGLPVSPAGDL